MNKKGRVEYLDYCKAIAIILVSFGHILGGLERTNGVKILLLICYSIELAVFYMISGIQFRLKQEETRELSVYFLKKMKRLLYPYFVFSVLYILFDTFILLVKYCLNGIIDFEIIIWGVIDTVTLWGKGALWFLPTLFIAEVLFFIIRKYIGGGYFLLSFRV